MENYLNRKPRPTRSWQAILVALAVAVFIVGFAQMLEREQRDRMLVTERETVMSQLAEFRARLESVINGNVRMVHGLTAVIAARPGLDQQEFAGYAARMLADNEAVRHVVAAPDMVVSLLYPLEGNEIAVGLDYRSHPDQGEQAMRAVESGGLVLAGPLQLVQGGSAVVAREPVFIASETPGEARVLWGLVVTVFDMDTLWALAGLEELEQDNGLVLAMRGRHGEGPEGDVFYGDGELFARQAVLSEVQLPGGSWQIGVIPEQGWEQSIDAYPLLLLRISGVVAAFMFGLLTFTFLRNHGRLRQSLADLLESRNLFQSFMDNLPAGAYIRTSGKEEPVFRNRWFMEHVSDQAEFMGEVTEELVDEIRSGDGRCECELQSRNGESFECECIRFIVQAGGDTLTIGGILQGVTERMSSKKALAEHSARLRTLIDSIPDLVWLKDANGVYMMCNRRFESLYGAAEEEIIGKTDHDFVDAELADFFRENDRAAMAAGHPTMNEETVVFASDGHEERLETIKAPLRGEDGEIIGVLGIARDISDRMRMADELHDKVGELSRWQEVILGREERIQELKREVNRLTEKLGEKPPYASVSDN